jgi:hypothetical protein
MVAINPDPYISPNISHTRPSHSLQYLTFSTSTSEAPILLIDDTEFQIVRHFKGQLYGEEPECEVVSGCTER